jgi:hypothetical protein
MVLVHRLTKKNDGINWSYFDFKNKDQ